VADGVADAARCTFNVVVVDVPNGGGGRVSGHNVAVESAIVERVSLNAV
jgi:hypothetical protein